MIQNFVSDHTFPSHWVDLGFLVNFDFIPLQGSHAASNGIVSNGLAKITGPTMFYNWAILESPLPAHIPVAIGASGSWINTQTQSAVPFVFRAEVPTQTLRNEGFDFETYRNSRDGISMFSFFPLMANSGPRTLTFKDVVSILPPQNPDHMVVYGIAFFHVGDNSETTMYHFGCSSVVKDGPVFQPNK